VDVKYIMQVQLCLQLSSMSEFLIINSGAFLYVIFFYFCLITLAACLTVVVFLLKVSLLHATSASASLGFEMAN